MTVARPLYRTPGRVFVRTLGIVGLAWLVVTFGVVPIGVRGRGMLPIFAPGDVLLVAKYERWEAAWNLQDVTFPKRGDLVVLKPPSDAADARLPVAQVLGQFGSAGAWVGARVPSLTFQPYLVRRVAALPGDVVRVTGGQVTVNGTVAYGQGPRSASLDPRLPAQAAELTVPPGAVYVTRDAPSGEALPDSRTFGVTPLSNLAGRVVARFWPPERLASIERGVP
ncbi:MAG TPA: signal peptidase I [Deinococcales bacterium]|nr:signal peptidase I [Deinococcales bacterium]